MNVKTLAIDLAKRVFFLHGEDEVGHVALRDMVMRARRATAGGHGGDGSVRRCAVWGATIRRAWVHDSYD